MLSEKIGVERAQRAAVNSAEMSVGTGPSFAFGTTGEPDRNVTCMTAAEYALTHEERCLLLAASLE